MIVTIVIAISSVTDLILLEYSTQQTWNINAF